MFKDWRILRFMVMLFRVNVHHQISAYYNVFKNWFPDIVTYGF